MATLTSFKRVGDQQNPSSNNDQDGQQNPTFVFDDIDNDQKNQQQQDAKQSNTQVVSIDSNNKQLNDEPAASATKKNPLNLKLEIRRNLKNGSNATDNNSGNGKDNVSVNLLAVDCVNSNSNGTPNADLTATSNGKSPRTPRLSPLMKLFKGKPRESVRRLYTEEDQFEIEWADLSLQLEPKWYQKAMNLMTSPLSGEDSTRFESDGDVKQHYATVETREQAKKILKNVDGRIKSGEITAVLGPSGAGKTSLLNGLFGKYRSSVMGSIRVTGAPSRKHLTVCTIPQSDYLIGYLTTQESLWFASRLKNCEYDFNHDRNIERVIELLGLQSCRNTRVNKLSGGQYKRVSIAQEMLSSPDILVLDEPTSGLDSLTCYRTVKVLRDLVEASKAHNLVNPMAIILTIHQPHHEVLDLFHSVYVLGVGGLTMFQGPPSEMEPRINQYSGVKMPAESYNPASFMVELASEEYGRSPIERLVRSQRELFKSSTKHSYQFQDPHPIDAISNNSRSESNNLDQSWLKHGKSTTTTTNNKTDSSINLYHPHEMSTMDSDKKFVDVDLATSGDANNSTRKHKFYSVDDGGSMIKDIDSRIMTPRSGKNSDGVFWRHVRLMAKRCYIANFRDPLLFTIRILAHLFIPLVVALIYGPYMGIPNGCPFYKPEINLFEYASMGVAEIREKHDAIRIQFQNVGMHFMVYYAFGLCMLAFTAISFPLIMHLLIKEIRNGWYSLGTFILGKFLSELPLAICLPPISVAIIYYMTGQPVSYMQWRYMVQSLILILIIMIAEAKGLVFGAICMNSMQTAVFAAAVSTVPFILLSGFLIHIDEIPVILQGVAKFSYFKHSVEALIITRYGFGMCSCNQSLIPPGGTPRITGLSPNIIGLVDYYIAPPATDSSKSDEDQTTTPSSDEIRIPGNNRSVERVVRAVESLPAEISIATGNNNDKRLISSKINPRLRKRRQTSSRLSGRQRIKSTTEIPTTTTATSIETTTMEIATTTVSETPPSQGVFFTKMAQLLTRANAFGYAIEKCSDVIPFTMKDMHLTDNMLGWLLLNLLSYIVVLKVLSYFIVDFCIKSKL